MFNAFGSRLLAHAPALVLVLTLGATLIGSRDAAAAPGPGLDPLPEATMYTYALGPANCNCTDSDADLQVCHSKSVSVRVGGSSVSVQTGLSEGTCAGQTVAPGTCIYYQYNFVCKKSFWVGWSCSLKSTVLKSRATDDTDCFDPAI